jgi:hypothetical protein
MNDSGTTPRILHLVLEGFPAEKLRELESAAAESESTEIFQLTPASAEMALEKIFAADHVAAWTRLEP